MIEIIKISDVRWDSIVRSFPNYDVYYLSGYAKPFQVNDDGEPILVHYTDNDLQGICVFMKRDIRGTKFFDLITPYGYGGFIFNSEINDKEKFFSEYNSLLLQNDIVSVFYRFHPQLGNAYILKDFYPVIDLGKTIEIDITEEEKIFENMIGKNRNKIRKAIKSNITIEHSREPSLFRDFIEIYNKTMEKDNAVDYYFFPEEFYLEINNSLRDNYELFYAKLDDKIIAMSIMLYANSRMHYHLSGSLPEYRSYAPTNLLLFEAAKWGNSIGCKTLHLGGGVGANEDGLFKFKQSFNRNCQGLQFSIAKQVVNQAVYDELVAKRQAEDPNFNGKSNFFPAYRK